MVNEDILTKKNPKPKLTHTKPTTKQKPTKSKPGRSVLETFE